MSSNSTPSTDYVHRPETCLLCAREDEINRMKCLLCGRKGHLKKDCEVPQLGDSDYDSPRTSSDDESSTDSEPELCPRLLVPKPDPDFRKSGPVFYTDGLFILPTTSAEVHTFLEALYPLVVWEPTIQARATSAILSSASRIQYRFVQQVRTSLRQAGDQGPADEALYPLVVPLPETLAQAQLLTDQLRDLCVELRFSLTVEQREHRRYKLPKKLMSHAKMLMLQWRDSALVIAKGYLKDNLRLGYRVALRADRKRKFTRLTKELSWSFKDAAQEFECTRAKECLWLHGVPY